MKTGGVGGANTRTGLIFEGETDLATFLETNKGYRVDRELPGQYDVYFDESIVGQIFVKHGLYRYLDKKDIDWRQSLSKRMLPDDSIFVIVNNTIFIIEKKFQQVAGSVDEKLQTCDFKKKQYQKLFMPLNIKVEYMYLLSEWFKKPEYKDVLDYVVSVGCYAYFEYIPLTELGLPVPDTTNES